MLSGLAADAVGPRPAGPVGGGTPVLVWCTACQIRRNLSCFGAASSWSSASNAFPSNRSSVSTVNGDRSVALPSLLNVIVVRTLDNDFYLCCYLLKDQKFTMGPIAEAPAIGHRQVI